MEKNSHPGVAALVKRNADHEGRAYAVDKSQEHSPTNFLIAILTTRN